MTEISGNGDPWVIMVEMKGRSWMVLAWAAAGALGCHLAGGLSDLDFRDEVNGGGTTVSAGGGGEGASTSAGGGGEGGSTPTGGGGFAPVADFHLLDVNATSSTFGVLVSPRDYLQQVSGWYFGDAT